VALALVIAFSAGSDSGAADGHAAASLTSPRQAREVTAPPRAASVKCPSVRKAVRFYQRRYLAWYNKMGAGMSPRGQLGVATPPAVHGASAKASCPRYLAHVWQRKAHAARLAYERWYRNQWNWRAWLPAKWYRIARCETGVRWDWNSGAYQGAFGFAVSSWDSFRPTGYPSEAYLATPRQQWQVALAIWRRYGFSGWGCRNA
jgi:hypothetical protein